MSTPYRSPVVLGICAVALAANLAMAIWRVVEAVDGGGGWWMSAMHAMFAVVMAFTLVRQWRLPR